MPAPPARWLLPPAAHASATGPATKAEADWLDRGLYHPRFMVGSTQGGQRPLHLRGCAERTSSKATRLHRHSARRRAPLKLYPRGYAPAFCLEVRYSYGEEQHEHRPATSDRSTSPSAPAPVPAWLAVRRLQNAALRMLARSCSPGLMLALGERRRLRLWEPLWQAPAWSLAPAAPDPLHLIRLSLGLLSPADTLTARDSFSRCL